MMWEQISPNVWTMWELLSRNLWMMLVPISDDFAKLISKSEERFASRISSHGRVAFWFVWYNSWSCGTVKLHGDQIDTLDKKRDKVEQRIDKLAQDLLNEIKIPKVGGHVNLIFA
jgi:hypothetical protein